MDVDLCLESHPRLVEVRELPDPGGAGRPARLGKASPPAWRRQMRSRQRCLPGRTTRPSGCFPCLTTALNPTGLRQDFPRPPSPTRNQRWALGRPHTHTHPPTHTHTPTTTQPHTHPHTHPPPHTHTRTAPCSPHPSPGYDIYEFPILIQLSIQDPLHPSGQPVIVFP